MNFWRIVFAMTLLMTPVSPAQATTKDTVVLLHGIGHSRWNMYWVERAMRKEGYEVVNITYPSLKHDIGTLSGLIHEELAVEKLWQKQGKVHFVTHSMGGLVTRRYLETYKSDIPQEKLGRVVMLAPPNGGSEVADFLKNFPPYKWSFGPAGQELATEARAKDLVKPYYELGIIAGSKKWPYVVANFIVPGSHDGRVTVEKTKLDGMKGHVTLPATHSFISWKPSVHKQIIAFLEKGEFSHE